MIDVTAAVIEYGKLERLVAAPEAGAVVSFYGVVRNNSRGRVTEFLEYEAYAPMAKRIMVQIAEEARERWGRVEIAIVHRVGRLRVGEISVGIAVASEHRAEGLAACSYVIDQIKERAPIWKRECGPDGSSWVEEHRDREPVA